MARKSCIGIWGILFGHSYTTRLYKEEELEQQIERSYKVSYALPEEMRRLPLRDRKDYIIFCRTCGDVLEHQVKEEKEENAQV